MDFEKTSSRGVGIEKLTELNYHVWKQKIDLVLTYREVDDVISCKNTLATDTDDPNGCRKTNWPAP